MGWLIGPVVALLLLGVCFEILESSLTAVPRLRTRWRTDLAWWFFTPLVARPLGQVVVLLSLAPVILALRLPRGEALVQGHGPLAGLPWWMQLFGVLLLIDGIGYWMHRLHHRSVLWDTHAIHHSSEHLDWLASVRVHPFNAWMQRAPGLLVVILLGFDLRTVAAAGPILGLWGIGLHANVALRLGPLVYLIATPSFHRWHHARSGAPEGGCNFAGLFPLWDLCLGTFHLPEAEADDFGVPGEGPAESLWDQLIWPVARIRRGGSAATGDVIVSR
ncbi:MAG TPA: sterol desaturase family protein [Deltaproteobacteria bacterium]|nr:sterol desaturase family protein [Deltaproteobacteria bacterium]